MMKGEKSENGSKCLVPVVHAEIDEIVCGFVFDPSGIAWVKDLNAAQVFVTMWSIFFFVSK